jgi:polysaccharide biosynthesis/export protein
LRTGGAKRDELAAVFFDHDDVAGAKCDVERRVFVKIIQPDLAGASRAGHADNRHGDIIVVEEDSRQFIALGATGAQSTVPFESETLSALEAIATVGGLSTASADPTGVFVLRDETEEIARTVLGRTDLVGDQRVVYVLDLTEPTGLFEARDFLIRDGDTLYVTEAPFVQWQKTLSAITGTTGAASNLANTANAGN